MNTTDYSHKPAHTLYRHSTLTPQSNTHLHQSTPVHSHNHNHHHHPHHHYPMHASLEFPSHFQFSETDVQQLPYAQKTDEAFYHFSSEYPPSADANAWPEWCGQQVAPEGVSEPSFEQQQLSYPGPSGTSRPTVLSWPLECFVTNDPSLLTPESDAGSSLYAPYSDRFTPELLYTDSPSGDSESANVFDMQFGDAVSSLNTESRAYDSESSASSSAPSPSSIPTCHYEYSRHSPYKRTPSPASCSVPVPGSRVIPASDHRRRFPCLLPGCDRRFTSQYTLKVHMEAHKPKPKVTFPCTHGCSERFSRQHDRLRHEVAKHGKVCEFSCDECGRFFSTSKTLGNHKCPVAQGGTRWVNA